MPGRNPNTYNHKVERMTGIEPRTISLGICAIRPAMQPDLQEGLPLSDREGSRESRTLLRQVRGEDTHISSCIPAVGNSISVPTRRASVLLAVRA